MRGREIECVKVPQMTRQACNEEKKKGESDALNDKKPKKKEKEKKARLTKIPKPRRKLTVERPELVLDGIVPRARLVIQMLAIPPERDEYSKWNACHVQQHEQHGQTLEHGVAPSVARDEQITNKHGRLHRALVHATSKD